MTTSTFAGVLAARLRTDPGQPLVTFYDEATGERVELSTTTWANWVAKVSSLLIDELGAERGQRLRIDLPPHWLGTVFLGAALNTGLVLVDDDRPDVVVTGPDTVADWAPSAGTITVLACSLRPLGVRFAEPLPAGVLDVGVEVWSQPDAFIALDPPGPSDPAVELAGSDLTQAQLWEAAVASPAHGRLLSETNPASPPGIVSLTGPLAKGGSVVLVAHADPDRLDLIAETERVTDRFLMP
ncbi:TIGR03089 family protein [Nocardioides sp.]|uniref:TIGR03089 family protein n=1 Tax=Nocardioides sp. TaxID=35761 RepID=UPI0026365500|nr:TIGR03089 family protein [Nocardioides sp.]